MEGFQSNDLPYKQLWHLLQGTTDIINEVVHEELMRRCDTIISGLMYYDVPEPPTHPPNEQGSTKKEKVAGEIMKALSVSDSVAMELLCLFLVYEYKGVVKPLTELLPTDQDTKNFIEEIKVFYKRERLCLLYCAQVILHGASNESHRFSTIFTAFVGAASMVEWCKWLCLSMSKAENEEEYIQVLHTLAILLYNYGHLDGVLSEVNKTFKFGKRPVSVLLAEGLFMHSILQSGDQSHDKEIQAFLSKHVKQLDENPYFHGAIVSAFALRCEQNERIRTAIQYIPQPDKCVQNMTNLVLEYGGNSFRNRHGLGIIVAKCVYTVAETILSQFTKETFGNEDDWKSLLNSLLLEKEIALQFMCEQPEELTLIYTEALMLFPVEIEWGLRFLIAICRTATTDVPALSILDRITEINGISKELEEIDAQVVRPNGNGEWTLLTELNIGGLVLQPGTVGIVMRDKPSILTSWELDPPPKNVTIWDVFLNVIIRQAYTEHPDFDERTIVRIRAIARFLSDFSELSNEVPSSFFNLFKPVIEILQRILYDLHDPHERSTFTALLLDVIRASAVYDIGFLVTNDDPTLWPNPEVTSYVTEIILTYESVLNSEYAVTKTFLKNVIQLFQANEEDPNIGPRLTHYIFNIDNPNAEGVYQLRKIFVHAINFILENVYSSFVRWRMNNPSDQFEIIRDTFRIFCILFHFKDPWFTSLKDKCCKVVLAPGNSLLAVLATDENKLQDSWIRPSKANQFLDETLFHALSLMNQLSNFDIRTLQMLDSASNLTIVKKLGNLVRHRLNPVLPTLAINLLRKMAFELKISILACFGKRIDSFRDLLHQRLEYKSEATQLKVAILDFLTVCAQTQPGLIRHFFEDESFTSCLMELLSDAETRLQISALCFVRALLRKGSSVFSNHASDIWVEIMKPIKRIDKFPTTLAKQQIISYTMNILSFEIYRCSVIEKEFSAALQEVLGSSENLLRIITAATDTPKTKETKKCIYALKHFLTLVLARPDNDALFPESVREICLSAVTDDFWVFMDVEENRELFAPLAELMLVLGPSNDPKFLDKLCASLPQYFNIATILAQVPLLTLINRTLPGITVEVSMGTIESIVRVLADVFFHASKIYDAAEADLVRPLLGVAASTMYGIIASPFCKNWGRIFKERMIADSIVCVANTGLSKGHGPEVVQDALGCLIRLSRSEESVQMLLNASFAVKLYLPLAQFSSPDVLEEKWMDVYMLCCELNSAMVQAGKFYFLEESLNFWAMHGTFIVAKLFAFTNLINHCYLQTPDQNFQTIKQLLSFAVVAFHGISVMIPYFQQWRLEQHQTLLKLMEGVGVTLETSVSLLSQPNHLLLVITKPAKGHASSPAFKLTPQLLDVQTKLWEVVSMGVHLYLKIGKDEKELVSRRKLLPLLLNIIGICGRAMSKHGDKKSHPVVNVTSEVTMSLEKGLAVLVSHVIGLSLDYDQTSKEERAFVRETSSELTTLCDMIRRLGLPPDDFSITMCSTIEEYLKEMLSK